MDLTFQDENSSDSLNPKPYSLAQKRLRSPRDSMSPLKVRRGSGLCCISACTPAVSPSPKAVLNEGRNE